MIGYVLLISAAVFMSFIVYAWMKSYLPKEKPECPSDVSIIITKVECVKDNGFGQVKVDIKNTGTFSVDGYVITGITGNGEIVDLTDGYYKFKSGAIKPGDEIFGEEFPDKKQGSESILDKIEVTPIKDVADEEGTKKTALCGDAKVSWKFNENEKCEVAMSPS